MDGPGNRSQIRPYYDPDTFNAGYSAVFKADEGVVDTSGHSIASKLSIVQSAGKGVRSRLLGEGKSSNGGALSSGKRLLSKGLGGETSDSPNSVSDMEWIDFLNLKAWKKVLAQLLDQFLRRYSRHLVQQPFEVARCLQQVGDFTVPNTPEIPVPVELRDEEDDDENAEIDFFPSTNDQQVLPHLENNEIDKSLIDEAHSGVEGSYTSNLVLRPESKHTVDILNCLMDNEGVRGLWKANNTTFIYNFLSVTLDAWFTGLISPFLGIPDPYFMDIIHSPDVKSSILLTFAANALTKMVLLPLDIIRTRFIVTSLQRGSKPVRSLRKLIRRWSWRSDAVSIPLDMWVLTTLQSLVSLTFNKAFEVLIYHQWNVERHSQPKWYHSLTFASQTLELFIKLPLENLLRRSQLNYLVNNKRNPWKIDNEDLIVTPVGFPGVWRSIRNKRYSAELWNGWRVGLMSLFCGYGFEIMNIDSVDLEQEKF
ncbi:hypothetical protein HG537_0A06130 [Torulaspora globosa]|uniref:Mitochondrial carrier n=1 Tax=Torulaspora globosa TaxID=48254 RepID=A0A7H9HM30_9SACH|nr:hypothetical protein HG537_0A06130 [Torulaspora sp. CBS 2947]